MRSFKWNLSRKSLGPRALKLAICLLMTLQSVQLSAEPRLDKLVKKGEPAPFSGMLVREADYRLDQESLEMYEVLKDFKPCPQLDDPCADDDFRQRIMDALLYALAGALTYEALTR